VAILHWIFAESRHAEQDSTTPRRVVLRGHLTQVKLRKCFVHCSETLKSLPISKKLFMQYSRKGWPHDKNQTHYYP
jgi:hypothetical protein